MRALARKTATMRQHAVRLYVEERWSAVRIATAFDVSAPAVYAALDRAGVARRPLAETTKPTQRPVIHGHGDRRDGHRSRTYQSWIAMKQRCRDPRSRNYRYYGARGITVCDAWRESFSAFLHDMGERPEGMSLDRIDVNGHYEPSNCRWATPLEQRANRRR